MEQLSALPGILHIEYDVEPGEVMPDMTEGTSLRAGTALVGGATEQQVRERINTLIAHFQNATSSV
jgi:hypothetical protein